MRSLPVISIITPCYNHARFIDETMRSIHSQGYANLEHIVVDGGSTDGTVEVIRRYTDRLAWWCSERDSGHGEALAKGIRRMTGDIFTWICSDDLLLPGALLRVARYFQEHPEEEWVAGDGLKIDENSRIARLIYATRITHSGLVYWRFNSTVQPSIFMRTRAFHDAGGIGAAYNLAPDFDVALRMARRRPSGTLRGFLGALRLHGRTQSVRRNAEMLAMDARLRQRELDNVGNSLCERVGGRYAIARYATRRLARLTQQPFAPSPYRAGERVRIADLSPEETPRCV